MKVKRLLIEHNKWARDSQGNYIKDGKIEGSITFENNQGSIGINCSDELCKTIIALCLGQVSLVCAEQVKELRSSFKEAAKVSPDFQSRIIKLLD
tara:strand:+ start:579 stop:863 length:285 start_codon:yes stop_codon:yes gene_type:complete